MVKGLGTLPYESRLLTFDLFPLSYKQLRGDLILTYGIMNNLDRCFVPDDLFTQANTPTLRGHPLKLRSGKVKIDGRKFFSSRVVAAWNALSEEVDLSTCANSFMSRLDMHQIPSRHTAV
ncbi:unnamed protein product [Dibothriocephalus latus]|uniref:Uncharacterized protein n=1 Tax=Dibothriocephalus latus TaxID=60516 RepID=A0A3P6NRE2_DIBLA|nr:unnamed protein product [Dibothriocephalus latus]